MLPISNERLLEIQSLLNKMNQRNKQSADGLGIYLGDGLPNSTPAMRSAELLSIVNMALLERGVS
jgi:hypothetical protein